MPWPTYSINVPLVDVVCENALYLGRIPPQLGVVLEIRVVEGLAPLRIHAKGDAGALEFLSALLAYAIVVAWWWNKSARFRGARGEKGGETTTYPWT